MALIQPSQRQIEITDNVFHEPPFPFLDFVMPTTDLIVAQGRLRKWLLSRLQEGEMGTRDWKLEVDFLR